MKPIKYLFLLLPIMFACKSKTDVSYYFDDKQAGELLTNIVTFVYEKPQYATNKTRFNAEYRDFYQKNSSKFHIEKISLQPDGYYYFWMIRPVANGNVYKRSVLGKFKLKPNTMMPEAFEEIVNTPHLKENDLKTRSQFLFNELVKNKNLDQYLKLKHYIEWPDSTLKYDKNTNEWVSQINP